MTFPNTQFGAPGRSTTLGLEHLVNSIHRVWLRKKKVTLLGLDLSGAYDHIDRAKLLDSLVSKGIPDWLVQIVWSFLSDRRTFIHLPGYEGGEYWIDVGIPQGSPLSPLLFLFYATPLLKDFLGQYAEHEVTMFSYVDDTYILLSTPSYVLNCKKIATIHDALDKWANANNLQFSPTKYQIMHFVQPSSPKKDDQIDLLPDITGFRNLTEDQRRKILPQTVVILGVTFDKRLTWLPHVQQIQNKVRSDLATFRRLNGATWGADFIQRRQLYYGKLLPKIGYAVAAWFIHDPTRPQHEGSIQYGLSKKVLNLLESIQGEILLTLSKAWVRTARQVMEKEMHVFPIVLKLHELAMNHRCRQRGTTEYEKMNSIRWSTSDMPAEKHSKSIACLERHPYHQLQKLTDEHLQELRCRKEPRFDKETFENLWSTPKTKKRWIKEFTTGNTMVQACMLWECYQRDRALDLKMSHSAHRGKFSDHHLKLYYGLDPAQSTILIAMRTGNIGLNANRVYQHAIGIKDPMCPLCREYRHTSEHLLCHCRALSAERTNLTAAANHNDFTKFMTEDTELAASWAICYFGLEQFKHVKDKKKYQFPRVELDPTDDPNQQQPTLTITRTNDNPNQR
ncbi:Nn.00g104720.m01.CDS01 [Neocucurbitaria sp. VM-36]